MSAEVPQLVLQIYTNFQSLFIEKEAQRLKVKDPSETLQVSNNPTRSLIYATHSNSVGYRYQPDARHDVLLVKNVNFVSVPTRVRRLTYDLVMMIKNVITSSWIVKPTSQGTTIIDACEAMAPFEILNVQSVLQHRTQ